MASSIGYVKKRALREGYETGKSIRNSSGLKDVMPRPFNPRQRGSFSKK